MENSGYLSEKRIMEIEDKLERVFKILSHKGYNPEIILLDNSDFMRHLKISNKTATIWRKQGKIPFSKVNNKIYYKLADVKKMIDDHKVFPMVKPTQNRNQKP